MSTHPDSSAPHTYPKRILLAVTGLSPQVVTETLYALAVAQSPAFVPTEVRLITTAEGSERAALALLSEEPGWFHRLCRDYALPDIAFDLTRITILSDGQGTLTDIRTPSDNERAADLITEIVRQLTGDPQTALHVSIAGGRKTMGFYLGYALSLYGRAQDRLSHVLVSEPFESSWDFFYPTPYERIITTRDNKLANCAAARVTLAEIPFVGLRHGLPEQLLAGRSSFSQTVAAAARSLGPPDLTIDLRHRRIRAADRIIAMPPIELAFYSWLARRRRQGRPPLPCPKDGVPEPAYAEAVLAEHRVIIGEMGDNDRTVDALRRGMDKNFFERHKSRINQRLEAAFGPAAAPHLIRRFDRRPNWTHGLDLQPGQIRYGTIPGGAELDSAGR